MLRFFNADFFHFLSNCICGVTRSWNSKAGMWKRKRRNRLNFCGSALKKEAGSGSELGSIW